MAAADLALPPPAEGSAEVAARVAAARAVQTARYTCTSTRTNAEVDGERLEEVAGPDEAGRQLLAQAAAAMKLSARGYTRVLRVARTIADLDASDRVRAAHVAEAIQLRVLDAGGPAGKRLDFLMQELNREANTLGSKSVSKEFADASLEFKLLIEQMREQVQNIE